MRYGVKIFTIKSMMLVVLVVSLAGCESRGPNIINIEMCPSNKDFECVEDISTFAVDTPELMVTGDLQKTGVGTWFTAQWRYLEDAEPYVINTANYELTSAGYKSVHSTLSIPKKGWPLGKYEVVLQLDNSTIATKTFQIRDQ